MKKTNQENKNCLLCKWGSRGDGKIVHKDDTVCVNADSNMCAEFVYKDCVCEYWEARDENF